MKRLLPIYSALILLVLYTPLAVMAAFSFNDSRLMRWSRVSTHWYADLAKNQRLLRALEDTLVIGAGTTLVSVIFGTMIALGLSRARFRGRRTYNTFVSLPIMVPDIAMGISLLMFFTALGVSLGRATVVIAQSTFGLSYAAIVVAARLQGFDRSLEDAALDLGATPWQAFWKVTFPALRPGIIAAALLCFTLSLDDFVITYFTTGPGTATLPIVIYGMVRRGVSPEINALSTLLTVASLGLILVSLRFTRSSLSGGTR